MAESSPQPEGSRRRRSREFPPDMRLVLVGKTGVGKSSSGNTIVGDSVFTSSVSASSVRVVILWGGRNVTVVDTPGLFDTSLTDDTVQREISKCVNMSCPGPHAFLLVIRMGPFTEEEQGAVEQIIKIFGPDAWRYTLVLFTQADERTIKREISDAGSKLKAVLERAGGRYHVLDNKRADDRTQVLELLEKIDEMVKANGEGYYSNPTYLEFTKMLEEREQQLKVRYTQELKEKVKALEIQYEKKLCDAKNDKNNYKKLLNSKEMLIKETESYYTSVIEKSRKEAEQMTPTDSVDNAKFHQTLCYKFI